MTLTGSHHQNPFRGPTPFGSNGVAHEKAVRGAASLDVDADFAHKLEGSGALADAAF